MLSLSVARSNSGQEPGASVLPTMAGHFEAHCANSALMGLPALIGGLAACLKVLPADIVDSFRIKTYHQASKPGLSTAYDRRDHPTAHPPHSVEICSGHSIASINASIDASIDESFQLRFNATSEDCSIQVRNITFGLAPIDISPTSSTFDAPEQKGVTTEQEIDHLVASASSVLGKVCDGVRFDDVTKVPRMLAEAILRVVRPLAMFAKIEQVSLRMTIGDDPLALIKTVSQEDLSAEKHSPESVVEPQASIVLPFDTAASILHNTPWRSL